MTDELRQGEFNEDTGSDEALDAAVEYEQHRVDQAYSSLDRSRDTYRGRLAEINLSEATGTHQSRSERESFAAHYAQMLARLENVEDRLVFGRLDIRNGAARYIGRIGLQDPDGKQILMDWRAPSAQPFYQATAARPGEVVRRRHLMTRMRQVISVEDELLDPDSATEDMRGDIHGEGALMAAMSAARTGRMNDIVSTIQSEQDAIIRAPLEGVLVVQGGPGTGKTAVALHRIAYLLYTHRERMERSGVLLVGPNSVFLRYIEKVLPSLGESDVVTTTIANLLPGQRATGKESLAAATIKGRRVMREVMKRLVASTRRVPPEAMELNVDGVTITLEPAAVEKAITRADRTGQPHNIAWETFAREVLRDLRLKYAQAQGMKDPETEADPQQLDEFEALVREALDVRRAINLSWMPRFPADLLRRLWARPDLLERLAPELSDAERDLLARNEDRPLTEADIPLLDELSEIVGPYHDAASRRERRQREADRQADVERAEIAIRSQDLGRGIVSADMLADRSTTDSTASTTAERAAADRTWAYGHIVVDEAQELSPMAWRMLLRRVPTWSMTLVGDLDQRRGHERRTTWVDVLGTNVARHVHESALTISYRTPAEVLDAATRVLKAVDQAPTRPVRAARSVSDALEVRTVDELTHETVKAAAQSLDALDQAHGTGGGRVAIIASPERLDELQLATRRNLRTAESAKRADTLGSRLVVIDPVAAKGLEFDHVILVEPIELLHDGAGDLYVAMTRPTRQLVIVHKGPLPQGL